LPGTGLLNRRDSTKRLVPPRAAESSNKGTPGTTKPYSRAEYKSKGSTLGRNAASLQEIHTSGGKGPEGCWPITGKRGRLGGRNWVAGIACTQGGKTKKVGPADIVRYY